VGATKNCRKTAVAGLVGSLVLSGCAVQPEKPSTYFQDLERAVEVQVSAKQAQHQPIAIINHSLINGSIRESRTWSLKVYNISGKTWKYLDLYVMPFNRVGDPACDIREPVGCYKRFNIVGPLPTKSGVVGTQDDGVIAGTFEDAWLLDRAVCAEIDGITITYMDDTKLEIPKEGVSQLLGSSAEKNSCKPI
jgi:hypothetical protein